MAGDLRGGGDAAYIPTNESRFSNETIDNLTASIMPHIQAADEWVLHVNKEWQDRAYKGSICDACCCTLGLLDMTWPTCLGFKYRGLCICLEGDFRCCIPNSWLDESGLPDAAEPHKKCIFFDGELYFTDPPCCESGGKCSSKDEDLCPAYNPGCRHLSV